MTIFARVCILKKIECFPTNSVLSIRCFRNRFFFVTDYLPTCFFFRRIIVTLPEMYFKVMFKCITAEKNDCESTYTKSSIFVANSLTHYKNPMVKFLFFFSFFEALTSLNLNQQSTIIYLLKKPRYFN
jgi:hypothetical protein